MTSDQMDLLVEQVKMLAGEIAFSTSTLKRLVDQSVNDPDSSKTQVLFSCLTPVVHVNSEAGPMNVPVAGRVGGFC